ncbi:MAG: glycosyltransferase family 9 protein, partial [Gemmatimonadaceae bacterium]
PPLHARFPGATIHVWCKDYTAPVARLIPHVSAVVAADPFWAIPPGGARPPIRPFVRSIAKIRRARYDVAVLSEAPWRAAAAVAAGRVPVRIGLARHRNSLFLTDVLPAADGHKPVLAEQARLLEPFGIPPGDPRYRLDPAPLESVRRELAERLPPRFVALHPFAGARDRCVPLAQWTQVAFALQGRGQTVLWVGTSRELHELRATYTHPKGAYVDHLGDRSLGMTAAALSLASVVVGHDSGPLHVAGAFGVPVVGIFAPGQPDRTFPQGVGPSRMLFRPSPLDISASMILSEIDALASAG